MGRARKTIPPLKSPCFHNLCLGLDSNRTPKAPKRRSAGHDVRNRGNQRQLLDYTNCNHIGEKYGRKKERPGTIYMGLATVHLNPPKIQYRDDCHTPPTHMELQAIWPSKVPCKGGSIQGVKPFETKKKSVEGWLSYKGIWFPLQNDHDFKKKINIWGCE